MSKAIVISFSLMLPTGLYAAALAAADLNAAPASAQQDPSAATVDTKGIMAGNQVLEEGKALYENGQYMAALGKFMNVLRRDPRQPEARQYLRLVIDAMRKNPASVSGRMGAGQSNMSQTAVDDELRKLMRDRARFTLDLQAIPGVKVNFKGSVAQAEIDTAMVFPPNSGGLKEQAVPVLDRVSAWLKTFGQQPVIIHCYPEELQDPAVNGSQFLHRYSELFSFFVDERKLPASRFVSADLLKQEGAVAASSDAPATPVISTTTSRIVIETLGSQTAFLEAMPSMNPRHTLSRWLEFDISIYRALLNPEEGEWTNIDIAAMTRTGVKAWNFRILSADKASTQMVSLEGKGNLLKRLSWDGRNQKTGGFAAGGTYVARLTATDSDGTVMVREKTLQVERTTRDEPAVTLASRSTKKKNKKSKKTAATVAVAKPAAPVSPAPSPETSAPAETAAPGQEPAAEAPAAEDTGEDSSHAIWKKVVQFEPGASELVPSVKASLESIGKTVDLYPLQKVRIVGFAMVSESNASKLARKRAEAVRLVLINQYHVEARRVIVGTPHVRSAAGSSKVELTITN